MSDQRWYSFLLGADSISIKHDLVCHQKYNKELSGHMTFKLTSNEDNRVITFGKSKGGGSELNLRPLAEGQYVISSELWSSQWWTQFKQLRKEAWKSQDFNGVQTPLKSWLFQASLRDCLNCVYHCDDHSSLDFISAVQYMKHFIYHFST